jgi:endophilin-A
MPPLSTHGEDGCSRANRQLGKVTQWTNEKVFSGEKTQLSSEFTQFERDIEIKKNGIER